jgi:SPP1 gp7 family putative phage head morphogenesis protein
LPLKSKFAARARARKGRKPTRAQRRARVIREPRAVTLWYTIQLRRVAAEFARIVRPAALALAERVGVHTDAADGGGPRIPASVRARVVARAKAIAEQAAPESGKRLERHSKAEFSRLGIKLREAEPKLGPLITRFRRENVELITSLVGRELDTIQALLADGEGRRVESLAKDIEERFGVTTSKAELIARDQTLKLNSAISHTRMSAALVTRGIWTTSGDERVRESHAAMDGVEFDLDDPPEVDGEKVLPGEPVQCRCTTYPVLPELAETEDLPAAAE